MKGFLWGFLAFGRIAYLCAVENSSIWGKGKNEEEKRYKYNKI